MNKCLLFLLLTFTLATNTIAEEVVNPDFEKEEGIVADSDRPNLYDKMRISRRWKKSRQRSKPQHRYCPKCKRKANQ